MNALLLIAHGSRSVESNSEIISLTSSLRAQIENSPGRSFDTVECAFLELTEPDIDTAVSNLVNKGAENITLMPYFLAKGTHVNKDIPETIAAARSRFPGVNIDSIPHIGGAMHICDLLIEHLQDHGK